MSRPTSLGQSLNRLRVLFQHAIRQAEIQGQPVLAATSFGISSIDPLQAFAALDDGQTPCFYWEGRQPDFAFLAWGCALEIDGQDDQRFSHVAARWQALCEHAVVDGPLVPRLCGGFRFDPHGPRQAHWQAFGDASLVLAHLTVQREAGVHRVLCQHLVRAGDDALALAVWHCSLLQKLRQPIRRKMSPAAGGGHTVAASPAQRQDWENRVAAAVRSIREGHLGKVVLARPQLQPLGGVQPWQVIGHLRKQQGNTRLFACRRGEACFLGASPERLVQVREGYMQTHALAGTAARSNDREEDNRLGDALLHSAKDRHEHRLVVEAIRTALAPYSEWLEIPGTPVLKRLASVQHLHTPVRARLARGAGILQLVQALHPTPAVGGYPRTAALDYIRRHEGMDRGWYAAPLGWLDGNGNGDFLVALRSALLTGEHGYLFAGCGLVEDSEPPLEYRETCLKLAAMQEALLAAGSRHVQGIPA